MVSNKIPDCELCNVGEAAAVFCPSDSAYLCYQCDSRVHEANFLVARHIRCTICPSCGDLDANRRLYGAGFHPPPRSFCRTCSTTEDRDNYASTSPSLSSSATESSTTDQENQTDLAGASVPRRSTMQQDSALEAEASSVRVERRLKSTVEEVLVNWCRSMGVECEFVVPVAVDVIRSARGRLMFPGFPSRLGLAASFWVGWKLAGGGGRVKPTCRNLKRVEEVTGTPAKLILAAESRLVAVLRRGKWRRQSLEEGWAES